MVLPLPLRCINDAIDLLAFDKGDAAVGASRHLIGARGREALVMNTRGILSVFLHAIVIVFLR
jgi:hypothetical protein